MKTKRLVALVLALTLVFCFMAMSASAATTEIQPRGTCPSCTYGYVETKTEVFEVDGNPYNNPQKTTTCTKMGASHVHYQEVIYRITTTCRNYGYVDHTLEVLV